MKQILTIFFLFISLFLFSQEVKISSEKVTIGGKKYYIHTVENSQTLYSICKKYNADIKEVEKINNINSGNIKKGQSLKIPYVEETPVNQQPNPVLPTKTIKYIVKAGDTKYSLCKNYEITEDQFHALNKQITKDAPLKIGQEIILPDLSASKLEESGIDAQDFIGHIVTKGETIFSIARDYFIKREMLMELNQQLKDRNPQIGEMVIIPKTANNERTRNDIILDSISSRNIRNKSGNSGLAACDSINWYTNKSEIIINILLPFDKETNYSVFSSDNKQIKDISKLSKDVLSFYSGCLLALDNFKGKGNKITINTYDTGKKNEVLEKLIADKAFDNCDMIIGPAFRSQVEFLNEKLVNNETAIIIPFSNDSDILRKYPNNILVNPSGYQVRRAIAKYITNFDKKNIIIIQGSESESIKNAAELQRLLKQDSLKNNKITLAKYDGLDFKKIITKDEKTFIISMISSEIAINNTLAKLYALLDYDITFIGDQNFLNYESVDPQYFSKVNFTYFSHNNVNDDNDTVKQFKTNYRKTFYNEPNNYSIDGYDVMNFFLDSFLKYGSRKCMDCLAQNFRYSGLSGNIQFGTTKQFLKNSYTNRSVYLYSLQPNYSLKLVYQYTEK